MGALCPGARDPIDVLEAQGATRVPELVPDPLRPHGRSRRSPSSGAAAAIMAMDLATTPVTGLTVQACGDAHVTNFGKFATPERNMIFDINDFDETLPGPWEWDVKRLCASLHVVARGHGFSAGASATGWCATAARTYRERMARLATRCGRSSSGTTASTSTRSSPTSPAGTGRWWSATCARPAARTTCARSPS